MKFNRPPATSRFEAIQIARALRAGEVAPLEGLRDRFGPICYLPFPVDAYVVSSYEGVRHVLATQHKRYVKSPNYRQLRFVLGDGLVLSEGRAWLQQRRQLATVFRNEALEVHARAALSVARAWAGDVFNRSVGVDLDRALADLATRLALTVLLGEANAETTKALRTHMDVAGREAARRAFAIAKPPRWIPTPRNLRERRAKRGIDSIVRDLTHQAHARPESRTILRELRAALPSLTPDQIHAQLVTFLLAGQDAMHASLQWLLRTLGAHEDLQTRIRAEWRERAGQGENASALGDLPTLQACIEETLRLYPPFPTLGRMAVEDDQMLGYTIPKGSVVLCALHAMHRDPSKWPSPDQFVPDRCHDAGEERAFFGLGPRRCIGERLALLELCAVVVALLERGTFRANPTFRSHTVIAMKPKASVTMRFSRS